MNSSVSINFNPKPNNSLLPVLTITKNSSSKLTKSKFAAPQLEDEEEKFSAIEKLEKKYKGVWNSNAQTITLTLPQFGFLLEMARR